MNNVTNAELLEAMLSSSIHTQFKEGPLPNETEFNNIANTLRQALVVLYPVTDDEFEAMKRRLRTYTIVVMDIGVDQ